MKQKTEPKKKSKKEKWIVSVPVEIRVCYEVDAVSQEDAIDQAKRFARNEDVRVEPLFCGVGEDIMRPSMMGVQDTEAFLDYDEEEEIFEWKPITAKKAEEI